MTQTNEKRCLLADKCRVAGKDSCNDICPHWIAVMGQRGTGGRAGAAGVPKDYRLVTVANSPARESQAQVYKAVDAYVRTFERQFEADGERIKSLFLFSENTGNGKTTTAVAILHSYLTTHYLGSLKRKEQPLQVPAYFLDVNEWQTLFNEFNRSNIPKDIAEPASREYYRRMQLAKNTPFVVCDDIGLRTASEAFRGDLHSVINHRTANGMPTVFTSNLPIEEMANVFDVRLYDRMRDQAAVLFFTGESKRGRR